MKRICNILFCLLLIAALSIPVQAADTVPKAVMRAANSVVRILAEYSDGYGTGSGFVIQTDGNATLIATNYHVVSGNPYSISVWLGENAPAAATILAYSEQKDLCVLSLPYPVSLKALSLSNASAKQGSAVYAVGFPAAADDLSDKRALTSADATITDGIISAIREVSPTQYGEPVTLLQMNAAINSGNSGGPLFNASGEVVGINTYGTYDSQGIFGAIDIGELKDLLADNHISIGKKTSTGIFVVLAILALIAIAAVAAVLVFKRKRTRPASLRRCHKADSLRNYMAEHMEGVGAFDAVAMLLPVALRLRNLHQEGRLHLQVSPDSVLVGPSGGILVDAGSSETARYTSGYASPEIYKGTNAGQLSDMYSFCALLFYAATGKQPENALSRTSEDEKISSMDREDPHVDDAFMAIIEKGMALSAENRFSSMQELIIQLAPYNVKPFAEKTERTPPAAEPKKEDSQKETAKRPRLSRKATVTFAVAGIVAVLIGGYLGSYLGARISAKDQNFTTANRFLIFPGFTRLHDSSLITYIEAGNLLTQRQYEDAAVKFRELAGYLDAGELAMEADYRRALQYADADDFESAIQIVEGLVEQNYEDASVKLQDLRYRKGSYLLYKEGDYKAAYDIFSKLVKEGYSAAEDMTYITQYQWALDLTDKKHYLEAYRKLDAIREYSDVEEVLDVLTELMYAEAQTLYREGNYGRALNFFKCILPFKDSSKYITLVDAHLTYRLSDTMVNSLLRMFNFEDVPEILVSVDSNFLCGRWTGDGYYFTMEEDGGIRYNLPSSSYGDYYRLSDGYILFYPENDWTATKKVFRIEVLSPDCIKVYCYQNNKSHTLYRQ